MGKPFYKWLAGAIEDQAGSVSSKRILGYFFAYEFHRVIDRSTKLNPADDTVVSWLCLLIMVCVGAITVEFLAKFLPDFVASIKAKVNPGTL
jgi:hypothetical protein